LQKLAQIILQVLESQFALEMVSLLDYANHVLTCDVHGHTFILN